MWYIENNELMTLLCWNNWPVQTNSHFVLSFPKTGAIHLSLSGIALQPYNRGFGMFCCMLNFHPFKNTLLLKVYILISNLNQVSLLLAPQLWFLNSLIQVFFLFCPILSSILISDCVNLPRLTVAAILILEYFLLLLFLVSCSYPYSYIDTHTFPVVCFPANTFLHYESLIY